MIRFNRILPGSVEPEFYINPANVVWVQRAEQTTQSGKPTTRIMLSNGPDVEVMEDVRLVIAELDGAK